MMQTQGRITSLLLILTAAVLAYLSTSYQFQIDVTANGRNSLSPASIELLQQLQTPLKITAFVKSQGPNRQHIQELIGRYQEHSEYLELNWVNPDQEPQKVRDQGIRVDGTLLIEYGARQEKLEQLDEQSITNALTRLLRGGEPLLLFVQGHGERRPKAEANHDLSSWVAELQGKGFRIEETQLEGFVEIGSPPPVMVLSQPQVDLLPGEIEVILRFVEQGGNLLWLTEPGPRHGLEQLQKALGVETYPGTLVDLGGQLVANNAAFVLAAPENYLPHPLLTGFDFKTLYPFAAGLKYEHNDSGDGWRYSELITVSGGWSETGDLDKEVQFDPSTDVDGPLPLALALTRKKPSGGGEGEAGREEEGVGEQRVIIIGDGDFLSNSYFGNGGNLTLALNMANWLGAHDSFINIAPKTTTDLSLDFTPGQILLVGGSFLLLLPLLLAITGFLIWWKRKRL